ncbi:MAG TPA: hypothetical protein PLC80_09920 [Draconibacterium sp.]|nr:hypothetical protein [Draconibacterium sp.]
MKHNSLTCQFSKQLAVKFNFAFFVILISNIFSCNVCYSQKVSDFSGLNDANFPRERIYLHIDKTLYTAGDDLWFKVYLVDADSHKPEALSKVAYVEIISPLAEILSTKIIKIDDGCGNGDFKLPIDLVSGEYTVRAYTTYMRNFDDAFFFRKKIYVKQVIQIISEPRDSIQENIIAGNANLNTEIPKPDVQFFPEGGYLICGFQCNIGIKAMGFDGKGIDVSGSVLDSSGKRIAEFSTLKFGLGEVQLVPLQEETYKARISWNNTEYEYELPLAQTVGEVMQVTRQEDFYHLTIRSSMPGGIKNFSFVGTQKSSVLIETKIESDDEGIILKVPKDIFEEGIVQFTLFNKDDTPCCERLVFVEKGNAGSEVNLTTSKKEYGKKELVELDVSTNIFGLPETEAAMSVSVASVSENPDNYATDIKSYLLLNSELKGEIEQPGYYFYSDDPIRGKVLDLLMMTQGWRRYIWNEPQITDTTAFMFQPETGLRFEGKITRLSYLKKSSEAIVSLTCSNDNEFSQYETNADETGHFGFDGIVFDDSTSVIIQAKRERKEGKDPAMNYDIELDELAPPKEPTAYFHFTYLNDETLNNNLFPSKLSSEEIDSLYNIEKTDVVLEEVIINAKKPDRVAEKRSMAKYREPDYSLNISESYSQFDFLNILQILDGRIPHIPAGLFLLDGIPVTPETALSIPISQIHFVDVLRGGAKTTVFGAAAALGVIAIYTLDAEDMLSTVKPRERTGIINFTHPGFSKAKEFYTPVYTSEESKQKPDYRTTLYWTPVLKLDEQGRAKMSFYTSDVSSGYKIILEGISPDGGILQAITNFIVN